MICWIRGEHLNGVFLVSGIPGVVCLDDYGFWSPVFLGSSVLMVMVFGLQYFWGHLS